MTESPPEATPGKGSRVLAFLALAGFVGAGTFAYLWLAARSDEAADRQKPASPVTEGSPSGTDSRPGSVDPGRDAVALEQARLRINTLEGESKRLRTDLEAARQEGLAARKAGQSQLEAAWGKVNDLETKLEELKRSGQESGEAEAQQRSADAREIARLRTEVTRLEAALVVAREATEEAVRKARIGAVPAKPETSEKVSITPDALAADVLSQLRRYAPAEGRPDGATREALRAALGTSPALLPALISRFPDPALGTLAVAHAGMLRDPEVAVFVKGLADCGRSDAAFIQEAASSLLRLESPNGLRTLLGRAHDDPSPTMRLIAVEVSGGRGVAGDGGVLSSILTGDDGQAALLALEKLLAGGVTGQAHVIAALRDDRLAPAVREAAITALVNGPANGLPDLVRLVAEDPKASAAARGETVEDNRRRELVADILGAPTNPALDQWMAALLGKPEDTPRAVMVAEVINDGDWQGALLAAARRGARVDPALKTAAELLPAIGTLILDPEDVLSLAKQARPVHVPFLLPNVERVPLPKRLTVAETLHGFGHSEGVAILERARASEDPEVRAAVLETAGRMEAAPATRLAEAALQDPDLRVARAALALVTAGDGVLAPEEARRFLVALEGEALAPVFKALERSDQIEGIRALGWELLNAEEPVADETGLARWYLARPDLTVDVLIKALAHPRPAVRAEAAGALAQREIAARPELLGALEVLVRDDEALVRARAAEPLGKLRHDLARTALVLLARDQDAPVREAAVTALGSQEPYHVVPVLRRSVRDPDRGVRNAARIALVAQKVSDEVPALIEDVDDAVLGPRTRRCLDALLGLRGRPDASRYRSAWEEQKEELERRR